MKKKHILAENYRRFFRENLNEIVTGNFEQDFHDGEDEWNESMWSDFGWQRFMAMADGFNREIHLGNARASSGFSGDDFESVLDDLKEMQDLLNNMIRNIGLAYRR